MTLRQDQCLQIGAEGKRDSMFSKEKLFITIFPSDNYLDSIQKIVPEDEWAEVASDNEFYRNAAEEYLVKKAYKSIKRPSTRFGYFKLIDGKRQVIDTLSIRESWGNLIFNGKDSPFIFEGTIPEIELEDKL